MNHKKVVVLGIGLLSVFIFAILFGAALTPDVLASGYPQQAGRDLSVDDWMAHLPLLVVVTVLVVIIDGAAIGFILRNRTKRQGRGES